MAKISCQARILSVFDKMGVDNKMNAIRPVNSDCECSWLKLATRSQLMVVWLFLHTAAH